MSGTCYFFNYFWLRNLDLDKLVCIFADRRTLNLQSEASSFSTVWKSANLFPPSKDKRVSQPFKNYNVLPIGRGRNMWISIFGSGAWRCLRQDCDPVSPRLSRKAHGCGCPSSSLDVICDIALHLRMIEHCEVILAYPLLIYTYN